MTDRNWGGKQLRNKWIVPIHTDFDRWTKSAFIPQVQWNQATPKNVQEVQQTVCQTVMNFFDFLFTPVVFWSIKQKNHLLILANLQDICKYVWSFMRVFCHIAFAINYLYVTPAPSTNVFCHCISIRYNLAVRLFANKILPLIYISWVSNFLPKSKFEFLSGATLNRYILLLELFIRKW